MPVIRVVLYQERLSGVIPRDDIETIREMVPDFLALPEHFFTGEAESFAQVADRTAEARESLRLLSEDLRCVVVGGTIVERRAPDPSGGSLDERSGKGKGLVNVCYVMDNGSMKGRYVKCRPSAYEESQGILPGEEMRLFSIRGCSVGILICADVLDEHNFYAMGELLSDLVFVPAVSPYKAEAAEEKFDRDERIFVEGAMNSRSYVIKTCGIGTIFGRPLQGRSLVAAPWGVLARVSPEEEGAKRILQVELDMEKIWAYQRSYTLR